MDFELFLPAKLTTFLVVSCKEGEGSGAADVQPTVAHLRIPGARVTSAIRAKMDLCVGDPAGDARGNPED